jgi:hypothetical protein
MPRTVVHYSRHWSGSPASTCGRPRYGRPPDQTRRGGGFPRRAFADALLDLGAAARTSCRWAWPEQNLIGITEGLAKAGLYPIAVGFGVFVTHRAYHQIAMGSPPGPTRATVDGSWSIGGRLPAG